MPEAFGLALPYYAHSELAVVETVLVANPLPGANANYVQGPNYIAIPLTAFCEYQTNATVATRDVQLSVQDPDGHFVWNVTAPATQLASTIFFYQFVANASAAYTAGTIQYAPLPPTVLVPGYKLFFGAGNQQAGDQYSQVALTLILIPTGIAQRAAAVPVTVPLSLTSLEAGDQAIPVGDVVYSEPSFDQVPVAADAGDLAAVDGSSPDGFDATTTVDQTATEGAAAAPTASDYSTATKTYEGSTVTPQVSAPAPAPAAPAPTPLSVEKAIWEQVEPTPAPAPAPATDFQINRNQ